MKIVRQVVKNTPKVSAVPSKIKTVNSETIDKGVEVSSDTGSTLVAISPEEQLVGDLVRCKALHAMYESVGIAICIFMRSARFGTLISSFLHTELWPV